MRKSETARLCIMGQYPSVESGRGLDRYSKMLFEGIKKMNPNATYVGQDKTLSTLGWAAEGIRFPIRLQGQKADLYHGLTGTTTALAPFVGKKPLVTTIHDDFAFKSGDIEQRFYGLTMMSARLCARVIVPYEVLVESVHQNLGIDKSRIRVVPYGVEHDSFYRDTQVPKRNVLLFVGSLSRLKGLLDTLLAFDRCRREVRDAQLVLVGRNELGDGLPRILKALSLESQVKVLGVVPNSMLRMLYSESKALVFPSYAGFGFSILESMSCGTPVIAWDLPDVREVTSGAALLAKAGDVGQLAQYMIRLLTDKEYEERYSSKSVEIAKNFSWDRTVAGVMHVYDELLG